MICNKCGKQIDNDSKFCIHCGSQQIDQVSYFNGNLEPFRTGSLFGYKDVNTRDVIVPAKYSFAGEFFENKAVVKFNNKFAFVDNNGNELTPFKYDFALKFINGFARVKRDDKWTFIDAQCKEITPFKYTEIHDFNNHVAKVKYDDYYLLINEKGEEITQNKYFSISDFSGNFCVVTVRENTHNIYQDITRGGLINNLGKEILKCEYDKFSDFGDSFIKFSKDGKYGLLDKAGAIILPCEYNVIADFKDDIAKLKRGDKYGFINASGKLIVPCKYKKYKILPDQLIAVKEKKEWDCINYIGELVSESESIFKKFKEKNKRKKIANIIYILIALIALITYSYSRELGIVRKIILGEERVSWEYARNHMFEYDGKSLKDFIKKYPNSKNVSRAKNDLEYVRWEKIENSNNLENFEKFLKDFPDGHYRKDAENTVNRIKKENKKNSDWNYLLKNPNINVYRRFINNYPNSKEAKRIKKQIQYFDGKIKQWKSIPKYYNNTVYDGITYNIYKQGKYYYSYEDTYLSKIKLSIRKDFMTIREYDIGVYRGSYLYVYFSKCKKYIFVNNNWRTDASAAFGAGIDRYDTHTNNIKSISGGFMEYVIESGELQNTIIVKYRDTANMQFYYCLVDFDGNLILKFGDEIKYSLFENTYQSLYKKFKHYKD